MPACKACGEWFAKTRDDRVLCSKCEMALGRLVGYAVVVTRCKDCEHLVNATVNDNGFLICDISDMEIAPDDFCSYGEPKETTQSLRP